MDLITDALIIALPLYLAARVQLPWPDRLALGGIFSLGIVIMLFSIIRIAVTNQHDSHPETSWLNLWSQIEASVAVVISALAPFRALFTRGNERKSYQYEEGTSNALPNRRRSGRSIGQTAIQLDERTSAYAKNGTIGFAGKACRDSTERILSMHVVGGHDTN